MFALTHIYCAKNINPKGDHLFLYGAIFPDLAFTGIIDWILLRDKTEDFSNYVRKNSNDLESFSTGLLVHEHPFGIDRFVHGKDRDGYAFIKGKEILEDLDFIEDDSSKIMTAHLLIEMAVEISLIRKNEFLLDLAKEIKEKADEKTKDIADLFSKFFDLPKADCISSLMSFNKYFDYGKDWERFLLENIKQYIEKSRKVLLSDGQIDRLINHSLEVIESDWEEFLTQTIEQCKKDFI